MEQNQNNEESKRNPTERSEGADQPLLGEEIIENRAKNNMCILCGEKLHHTPKIFTGTCNYNKGQYIYFYACKNIKCSRYLLFVDFYVTEK